VVVEKAYAVAIYGVEYGADLLFERFSVGKPSLLN
jgi:hypothetical protein